MDDNESQGSAARGIGGCLMQVVTHTLAVLVGAGLGMGGVRLAEYYENPEVMSRPEGELSRAELIARLDGSERAYADLLAQGQRKETEQQTELQAAGEKVAALEGRVSAKEDEVKVLELKVKKSAGKSAALKKELEAKQLELDGLRTELQTALQEKAQLQEQLVVSREETAVARVETQAARDETQVARGETVDVRWVAFASDAIVQICEKGNRNKLAKCKDEVRAAMNPARERKFKQCVSSGQASPRLVRTDPKAKEAPVLPRWSEWVDQEAASTKNGWYLVFCDPTLPEATGMSGGAAPASGRAVDDEF
jgi:predicted  nucleic acid-binding Zn-ribbon protein